MDFPEKLSCHGSLEVFQNSWDRTWISWDNSKCPCPQHWLIIIIQNNYYPTFQPKALWNCVTALLAFHKLCPAGAGAEGVGDGSRSPQSALGDPKIGGQLQPRSPRGCWQAQNILEPSRIIQRNFRFLSVCLGVVRGTLKIQKLFFFFFSLFLFNIYCLARNPLL